MGVEVGPAVRNISAPVNRLGGTIPLGRVRAPVNEGPVTPRFLEKTIPLILGKFNPEPKMPPQTISVANTALPSGAEAVDIVEKWLGISKPRTTLVNNIEPLVYATKPVDLLWKQPEVLPFSYVNEPKIPPKTSQIELSKSYPYGTNFAEVNTKSVQENSVRQIFEEKVLVKQDVDEKTAVFISEEDKLKDVLDGEVLAVRISEFSEATDKAGENASGEIEGRNIVKFLPAEHTGNRSGIIKQSGPDGSRVEAIEEIAARKFASVKEAKKEVVATLYRKEPVKRGKEGKTVKEGAVERVLKYHLVKRSPNQEVDGRVVKKQTIQTGNSKQLQVIALEPAGQEQRIEDTPLAEVFQKAA